MSTKQEEKIEAREYRCCMCPNEFCNMVCPSGPMKPEVTQCGFVIIWIDDRGWRYKVMSDQGGTYRGRYQDNQHSGEKHWVRMKRLKNVTTFDQAQEDLNKLAILKKWTPVIVNIQRIKEGRHQNG